MEGEYPQRIALKQLLALRAMMNRGFVFTELRFNETTSEIIYERNDCEFVVDPRGEIYRLDQVPVTTYKTERYYVSDYREETDLARQGK